MSDMTENSPETSMRLLQWAAIIFAGVTVIISIVFFGWWTMKEHFTFGHERFDTVRWMAVAKSQDSCDRGEMVLDVKNRLLKRGMSKADVTVLLGRPAWEDPNQIEYELGMCLWVVHGLRLYFDEQGRLAHSDIVQH